MEHPGEQWWRPERFARRRERLEKRGRILAATRGFFASEGFVEVDTPALQVSPGLEPHLKAFATQLHDPRDGSTRRRYLHTSPDFAMKKLLAAGMPRIWQLAHAFRDGVRGPTHHPEFSMLEWYRAGASWRELIPDCVGLLRAGQQAAHSSSSWPGSRGTRRSPRLARAQRRRPPAVARDQRRPGVPAVLRHRHPGDGCCSAKSGRSTAGRRGAPHRHRAASGRRLGDALFPHLPRPHRAASRHRRADDPLRLPGLDGRIVAAQA